MPEAEPGIPLATLVATATARPLEDPVSPAQQVRDVEAELKREYLERATANVQSIYSDTEWPDLARSPGIKAQIYVEALRLADQLVGGSANVMADLVAEMEQEDLLRHHPAKFTSMAEMLDLTLKHTLHPGRLIQLVYMRNQVLPLVPEVLDRLEGMPSVSNLEEIAPQCRAALAHGVTPEARQAVAELVEKAGTMAMRDLRLDLRPPDMAPVDAERISPSQVEIHAVLTNGQWEKLKRIPWMAITLRA